MQRVEVRRSSAPQYGMMIQAVHVFREGGESRAGKLVVLVQDMDGTWHRLGDELLDGPFSHIWSLPQAVFKRGV